MPSTLVSAYFLLGCTYPLKAPLMPHHFPCSPFNEMPATYSPSSITSLSIPHSPRKKWQPHVPLTISFLSPSLSCLSPPVTLTPLTLLSHQQRACEAALSSSLFLCEFHGTTSKKLPLLAPLDCNMLPLLPRYSPLSQYLMRSAAAGWNHPHQALSAFDAAWLLRDTHGAADDQKSIPSIPLLTAASRGVQQALCTTSGGSYGLRMRLHMMQKQLWHA